MTAKPAFFEPAGLPGYRVFRDPQWAGSRFGDWFFTAPEGVIASLEWDEETKGHNKPVFNDWAKGPRKTAKGAVAFAHQHDRWAQEQAERIASLRASSQAAS